MWLIKVNVRVQHFAEGRPQKKYILQMDIDITDQVRMLFTCVPDLLFAITSSIQKNIELRGIPSV